MCRFLTVDAMAFYSPTNFRRARDSMQGEFLNHEPVYLHKTIS
jgi:hypothetical protein